MTEKIKKGKISIALCTCEGSAYLFEQLQSFARQSLMPDELVVFDDHSNDNTVALVDSFAREAPFTVKVVVNEKRLGVIQNFSRAIECCSGEYVALCDQDDIWNSNKLELSLKLMQEAERFYGKTKPLLVHSDLAVIDTGGQVLAPSFMKMRRINDMGNRGLKNLAQENGSGAASREREKRIGRLLAQNYITGCTVLANRALIDVALPVPGKAVMHDWWLALVAAAQGNIIFLKEPLVGYRRHEGNVIGARGFISRENISRILQFNQVKKEMAAAIAQAICLRDRLKLIDSDEDVIVMLNDYVKYLPNGGFSAVRAVFRHGGFKQGLLRNAIYLIMLLEGSYSKDL